jgi:outer membrane receptor protein involved in Fe transport
MKFQAFVDINKFLRILMNDLPYFVLLEIVLLATGIYFIFMKNIIITLFSIGIISSILQAQGPNQMNNVPAGQFSGLVKGVIHDSTSNGAIEYATVGLYRQDDSSLVMGTITDQKGVFTLQVASPGKYFVEAAFLGYTKKVISGIILNPKKASYDLGTVVLHPYLKQIGEVTVSAQNKRVEYKIDKKVVNVSQDIAASGGSLVNVLENTPSVQVDIDGNVVLRGSGNFQLLIDGKPSVVKGSEGLQQIPASAVQSLEIITSPSAKYDPDGDAGIINVIMKKQKNIGIGGVVNASVGSRNKYTGDFLLNFRRQKFNFYVGSEYANQKNYMENEGERRTYGADTTTFILSAGDGIFDRQSINLKSGLDYYLDAKSTLSLSGAITDRNFNRYSESRNHWYTEPASIDSFYIDEGNSGENSLNYNLNIDFIKKYDDKGHQLQASVYYAFGKENESETTNVSKTNSNYEIIASDPFQTRSRTEEPESNLRLELDYARPMGSKLLEAGLQSRWDNCNAKYIYEDYQTLGEEWVRNDSISNTLDYLDAIQSAYASLSGPIARFDYKLGLRAEYDNRSLDQLTSQESYTYEKLHFFPSFFINRKIGENHQVQLNYSRRVRRPDERDLNPFKEYRGSNNVHYGNPELRPEFTNAFELNYQYTFKKGFVSLETYYRLTNDKISRINGVDTLNGRPVYTSTSTNANNDNTLGVELMGNADITKWWQLNLTGNLFRYQLTGEVDGQSVNSVSTSWRTNLNSFFKLKWDSRFQVTAVYNGPTKTLQGEGKGFFVTNLALRKEFFKKQFIVSLNARDIFSTAASSYTSEGSSFYTYNKGKRESPVFTINLTYRINNYRQAAKRTNGEQGEGNDNFDMGM